MTASNTEIYGKLSNIFFSVTFISETGLVSDKAFKKALCTAPRHEFKFGELDGHCSVSISCGQFACRHC